MLVHVIKIVQYSLFYWNDADVNLLTSSGGFELENRWILVSVSTSKRHFFTIVTRTSFIYVNANRIHIQLWGPWPNDRKAYWLRDCLVVDEKCSGLNLSGSGYTEGSLCTLYTRIMTMKFLGVSWQVAPCKNRGWQTGIQITIKFS